METEVDFDRFLSWGMNLTFKHTGNCINGLQ
jgi:hypothetical protein